MLQRIGDNINDFISLRQLIRRRPLQHLVAESQMIVQQDFQTFLNDRTSPSSIEEFLLRNQDLHGDRVVD